MTPDRPTEVASIPSGLARAWLDHPPAVSPTVLILGGFLTAPPLYRGLVRNLRAHGAAGVVVARVWTPDWLLAAQRGSAAVATRAGRALLTACRLSSEVSDGAPVLVVGHSAGGLVARILTAAEPYPGRRFGAAERIGAIVTLGSPHALTHGQGIGRRVRSMVSAVAQEAVPGAFFAPRIGYVSVASGVVRSDPGGNARERLAHLMYRSVIGRAAVSGTEGDGLVPVAATFLEGARRVVVSGAVHGPSFGSWYGSQGPLAEWWPVALEAWRAALAIRAEEARPSETRTQGRSSARLEAAI